MNVLIRLLFSEFVQSLTGGAIGLAFVFRVATLVVRGWGRD